MGSEDLFKKKKLALRRSQGKREPFKYILIVCEGEKTEPNYFRSFNLPSAPIIEGTGKNTLSLVEEAIEIRDKKQKELNREVDSTWCVFDKDSFPDDNFTNAIDKARANKVQVAYSNESFELWYLLHYHYVDTAFNRQDLIKKLTNCLGQKYMKNDCGMYAKLLDKQEAAIINAKKLLAFHKENGNILPQDSNPSTTVYKLVEFLNKEKSKQ